MASAWGNSWGSAWGDSWGRLFQPASLLVPEPISDKDVMDLMVILLRSGILDEQPAQLGDYDNPL